MTLRRVIVWLGAIAIVLASYWITLAALDYWAPEDPDANVIHITAATYGANCQGTTSPSGSVFDIKPGNATGVASRTCDNARGTCIFHVDVNVLGDPAPDCGKDFRITWRCGAFTADHHVHIDSEANTKAVTLTCPGHEE